MESKWEYDLSFLLTRGTTGSGENHNHSDCISRFTGRSYFHIKQGRDAKSGFGVNA